MPRATLAAARFAFASLLLSVPFFAYAATNPPQYTGELTINACYNQTNGQVRLVKPWGPNPECVPPPADPSVVCTEGGQFDCKVNEFFLELNTQGPKGDIGPVGPQGPKGDTGDRGPAGWDGKSLYATVLADGRCGAAGGYAVIQRDLISSAKTEVGLLCNGAKGDKGDTGAAGAAGAPGLNGAPGEVATIAIGTTNTVPPGTPASVTNSGTSNAAVLNFSIPQGPKGDTGAAGATGPQGPQGDQGPAGTCSLPDCPAGRLLMSTGPSQWACRSLCSGVLIDLTADRQHCGTCNISCLAGQVCAAGQCAYPDPPPPPPVGLYVDAYSSYQGVILRWTDDGAEHIVYRSSSYSGPYARLNPGDHRQPREITFWFDPTVTAGTTYWYRVSAWTPTGGEGPMSSPVSFAVPFPP